MMLRLQLYNIIVQVVIRAIACNVTLPVDFGDMNVSVNRPSPALPTASAIPKSAMTGYERRMLRRARTP